MTSNKEEWQVVRIPVPVAAVDLVGEVLFEHGCAGLEEVPVGGGVELQAYFPEASVPRMLGALASAWPHLRESVRGLSREPKVTVDDVPAADWAEGWKKHFKPLRVGKRLVISPTWEEPEVAKTDLVIRIDPGAAFGTGSHETTRLCLEELEQLLSSSPGIEMLDVGTGSAILSIAAVKLGAAKARGIDIDEDALLSAQENLRNNGVDSRVELDATPVGMLRRAWPLVVANILAELLRPMAADLWSRVSPGGTLILCGILEEQQEDLASVYQETGFELEAVRALQSSSGEDQWVLLRFRRPA